MRANESQRADALEAELCEDDRALLDKLADGIARRRLTPAALFFLESIKPLGFLGSQVMWFLQPIIQIIWRDPATYLRVAKLLERRGSIELLLRRLEARA
ncbi:MAG TPA: hypothetical protein VFG83_12635 [Kofleriaceae bacterium]|nr:hypothetical protein [Kofleriaceae bacterium]